MENIPFCNLIERSILLSSIVYLIYLLYNLDGSDCILADILVVILIGVIGTSGESEVLNDIRILCIGINVHNNNFYILLCTLKMSIKMSIKKSIKNLLPSTQNLIIILTNVLSFMTMQTVFFWYIASNNVANVIDNKSEMIIQIVNVFIDSNYININSSIFYDIQQSAQDSYITRYNHNTSLIIYWIIPSFVVVIVSLLAVIIECRIHKKKFDKIDRMVLGMVCLSFFTEVIFYFIVIYRAEILSDMDIMKILLSYLLANLSEDETMGIDEINSIVNSIMFKILAY